MKKLITSMLLFLVCLTGLAQENNDVLYIQPSKEMYETGEDLWFKAYLMDRPGTSSVVNAWVVPVRRMVSTALSAPAEA